ncbi:MAG: peptidoglycan-binding domain-containing protein [Pseudomonadota bacterium]
MKSIQSAVLALVLLSGCGGVNHPYVTQLSEPEPIRTGRSALAGTGQAACRVEDTTPAVIETETEQVMVQPAVHDSDGTLIYAAQYHTFTRQRIVRERVDLSFDRVCAADLTPDFIASLQRALAVRGYFKGPADGVMTPQTQAAIRSYQEPQGLNSAILSLAAARQLGLAAVRRVAE